MIISNYFFFNSSITVISENESHSNSPGDEILEQQDVLVLNEEPKMYKVLLLNDDYTPMEFVVHILKFFFGKSEVQAEQVMLEVHHKGKGVAGVYSLELAETKAYQVQRYAKEKQHPLKCVIEEA